MRSLILLKFGKFETFMAFNMSAESAPNTACTEPRQSTPGQVVALCAFSGTFRGFELFRKSGVISSRPPAGNASRWALESHGGL